MPRDFGVGVANGLIGGLTGLGGIAVTIWCQLRGGPKDAQRAIFQPVMFATFPMSAISLAVAGAFSIGTLKLYALALPALVLGIWCGTSNFTASSTMRRSAKSSCFCCSLSGLFVDRAACVEVASSQAGPAAVAPHFPRLAGPSTASSERRRLMRFASFFISPDELWSLIGTRARRRSSIRAGATVYDAAPGLLPTPIWRDIADIERWSASLDRSASDRGRLQARPRAQPDRRRRICARDGFDARVLAGGYAAWTEAGCRWSTRPRSTASRRSGRACG